jgi:hypothetical protein
LAAAGVFDSSVHAVELGSGTAPACWHNTRMRVRARLWMPLQVQTPPANITLADEEKDAMMSIWKECCPVTKGLEAPDICANL